MRVGVVVPTADRTRPKPVKCLEALECTTRHLDVQVEVVESSGPGFSFSGSINRGIAACPDADAWVLLNDDCYMDTGWLDAMLATVERNPRVGVVGAVLRFPDGPLQHAGGWIALEWHDYFAEALRVRAPFWAVRELKARRQWKYPWMFGHYRSVSPRHRLDFVTGACQLITRSAVERVGVYDPRFVMGGEDIDYCIRVLDAGMEVALCTGATGVHEEGASTSHMTPAKVASVRAFQEKWSPDDLVRLTRHRLGVHDRGFPLLAAPVAPAVAAT